MIAEFGDQLALAWRSTSWVEVMAALLAVAYVVLAIDQRLTCWVAAFFSSCLYVWVMFGARLYMESLLYGFYAVMAVYGYWEWSRGADGKGLKVCRWPLWRHGAALSAVIAMSLVTSYFLRRFTPAAWPFTDSAAAWSSVFATFLVARKVYENWHWWLVIDSLSVGLYFARGLYITMLLFLIYVAMIIIGMRAWRREVQFDLRATARL